MTPRNPFPGMNPYLEGNWADVHLDLISQIRVELSRMLPPDLYSRAETQVVISDGGEASLYRADVAVSEDWRQGLAPAWRPQESGASVSAAEPLIVELDPPVNRWLEIHETGGRLVTVIEVLSVSNKIDPGRRDYMKKAAEYREAGVSLAEIDLLRTGSPVLLSGYLDLLRLPHGTRYFVTVSRGWQSPSRREIYACPLRDRLPAFRIPLRETDQDIVLDLQPLIDRCYQNGRYWLNVPDQVPGPALSEEDAAWVRERMTAAL